MQSHSVTRTRWQSQAETLAALLRLLDATDAEGCALAPDEAFERWCAAACDVRARGGEIHFAGNGASASMASHCAADLAKNGCLRTRLCTDLSLITAVGNDLAYEEVFAAPLRVTMRTGDMVVLISSSGRSPNVLNAASVARALGGLVVTLSGFSPDNPLRCCGDLNFYLPAQTYGNVESCHAAVLHHWIDLILAAGGEKRP